MSMSFTIFDIIILTILVASCLHGGYLGIIKLTINLCGFLASLIMAFYLYSPINEILAKHIHNEGVLVVVSAIVSYILSLVIFSFITNKITATLEFMSGGMVDRLLGLIGGLARGGIISIVIFTVVAVFTSDSYVKAENLEEVICDLNKDKYPPWLQASLTSTYLDDATHNIADRLPKNYLKSIKLPHKKGHSSDTSDVNPMEKED